MRFPTLCVGLNQTASQYNSFLGPAPYAFLKIIPAVSEIVGVWLYKKVPISFLEIPGNKMVESTCRYLDVTKNKSKVNKNHKECNISEHTFDCLFLSLWASSTTSTAQSIDCRVVISIDTSSYDVNNTWNFTGWSFYKTKTNVGKIKIIPFKQPILGASSSLQMEKMLHVLTDNQFNSSSKSEGYFKNNYVSCSWELKVVNGQFSFLIKLHCWKERSSPQTRYRA